MSVSNILNSQFKIPASLTTTSGGGGLVVLTETAYGEYITNNTYTLVSGTAQFYAVPLWQSATGPVQGLSLNNADLQWVNFDLPGQYTISVSLNGNCSVGSNAIATLSLVYNSAPFGPGSATLLPNTAVEFLFPNSNYVTQSATWSLNIPDSGGAIGIYVTGVQVGSNTITLAPTNTITYNSVNVPTARISINKVDTDTTGVTQVTSGNAGISVTFNDSTPVVSNTGVITVVPASGTPGINVSTNTSTGQVTLQNTGILGLQGQNGIQILPGNPNPQIPIINFIGSQSGPVTNVTAGDAYIGVAVNGGIRAISNLGIQEITVGNDLEIAGNPQKPELSVTSVYGTLVKSTNFTAVNGDGQVLLNCDALNGPSFGVSVVGNTGSKLWQIAPEGKYKLSFSGNVSSTSVAGVDLTFYALYDDVATPLTGKSYTVSTTTGSVYVDYSVIVNCNQQGKTLGMAMYVDGLITGETVTFLGLPSPATGIPATPTYSMTLEWLSNA